MKDAQGNVYGGFTFVTDLKTAEKVNKDKSFMPPDLENYLIRLQEASGFRFPNLTLVARNALFFVSGSKHATLRRKIMNTLGKAQIRQWAPMVDDCVDRLISGLDGVKDTDLLKDFVYPLYLETTHRILGLNVDDANQTEYWTQKLHSLIQPLLPLRELQVLEAGFGELLHRMRRSSIQPVEEGPRSLLQELLGLDMEDYNEEDAYAAVASVYGAAISIQQTLANIIWHLLSAPFSIRENARDPEWVQSNLEYLLKIGASPRYIHSISSSDKTIDGIGFCKGKTVAIDLQEIHSSGCIFSGEKQWDSSAVADDDHIVFGKGLHFCVGAFQSRLVIGRAIPRLFSAFPQIMKKDPAPDILALSTAITLKSLNVYLYNN